MHAKKLDNAFIKVLLIFIKSRLEKFCLGPNPSKLEWINFRKSHKGFRPKAQAVEK